MPRSLAHVRLFLIDQTILGPNKPVPIVLKIEHICAIRWLTLIGDRAPLWSRRYNSCEGNATRNQYYITWRRRVIDVREKWNFLFISIFTSTTSGLYTAPTEIIPPFLSRGNLTQKRYGVFDEDRWSMAKWSVMCMAAHSNQMKNEKIQVGSWLLFALWPQFHVEDL
jgi:hypothetical protein